MMGIPNLIISMNSVMINFNSSERSTDMEDFIPFEKLSKKKQRKLNAKKRGSWYGLNPVTRKPENSRAYNRRRARKWSDNSMTVPFAMPVEGF